MDEITSLFKDLPKKPRYINDAPHTFSDITRIVVDRFAGHAENIWKDNTAMDVKKVLLSIHGVGSGIANMTLVLLESAYSFTFVDHNRMDIKPDVHTMRVLYRLGVSADVSAEEATSAAQWLNPSFPGMIDGPLWSIGRNWCHPTNPECVSCPLNSCCERVGL
jgi:endonuclease III